MLVKSYLKKYHVGFKRTLHFEKNVGFKYCRIQQNIDILIMGSFYFYVLRIIRIKHTLNFY
jgi:hypothetical protein